MGETGEEDQEVQTSSYRVNKSWGEKYNTDNIVNFVKKILVILEYVILTPRLFLCRRARIIETY